MTDFKNWAQRSKTFTNGKKTYYCATCGNPVEKVYQRCQQCRDNGIKRSDWFRDFAKARGNSVD